MTLTSLVRAVFAHRWIVALSVAVALVCGALIWLIKPPTYTSEMSLYVSAGNTENASAAYQGSLLSQQRVTSYVEIVTSPRVLVETNKVGNLNRTIEDLEESISAKATADSVLIDVEVTANDPAAAQRAGEALAGVFPTVVDDLERPADPGSPAVVRVRVAQPATIPVEASSLGLPALLGLALLAGALVGVGSAILRATLDTRVRDSASVGEITGSPCLAETPDDPGIAENSVVVDTKPTTIAAESYRQLRTNLLYIHVDVPPRVLLVSSPSAGEGKTTTVLNLAAALSIGGSRVLIIDGDLRRPRVAKALGLEGAVGLTTVLSGRMGLREAVQKVGSWSFDVLASGGLPPNPSELLGSNQMRGLLEYSHSIYDYVIVDTPPILPVTDAVSLAPTADGTILVCRYLSSRTSELQRATQALRSVSATLLGTVFTFTPRSNSRSYHGYTSDQPTGTEPTANSLNQRLGVNGSQRATGRPSPVSHHIAPDDDSATRPSPIRRAP